MRAAPILGTDGDLRRRPSRQRGQDGAGFEVTHGSLREHPSTPETRRQDRRRLSNLTRHGRRALRRAPRLLGLRQQRRGSSRCRGLHRWRSHPGHRASMLVASMRDTTRATLDDPLGGEALGEEKMLSVTAPTSSPWPIHPGKRRVVPRHASGDDGDFARPRCDRAHRAAESSSENTALIFVPQREIDSIEISRPRASHARSCRTVQCSCASLEPSLRWSPGITKPRPLSSTSRVINPRTVDEPERDEARLRMRDDAGERLLRDSAHVKRDLARDIMYLAAHREVRIESSLRLSPVKLEHQALLVRAAFRRGRPDAASRASERASMAPSYTACRCICTS